MSEDLKWQRFVTKLKADTLSGKLSWEDVRGLAKREGSSGGAYMSQVLNKMVLVYPFKYRSWVDDENFEWADDVAIEIVELEPTGIITTKWRLPEVGGRQALLNAIEFKVSGADDFLDRYLDQ